VPWKAWVFVVVHLWLWGGPRGYWFVHNTWSEGELDQVHGNCWDGVTGCWVVAEIVTFAVVGLGSLCDCCMGSSLQVFCWL